MDTASGAAVPVQESATGPDSVHASSVSHAEALAWFEARKPSYQRLARSVAPYVPSDGTILDIGANIGYFTKILGETLGLTGTVHLFEPIPNLAALCRETVAGLPFRSIVHEFGLSDEDAEIDIFSDVNGNLGWNTIVAEAAEGMTVHQITVRRFDPGLLDATPAFIKIDVGGAEAKVISDMLDAVAGWSPRPPILCEIGWGKEHPHWDEARAVFDRLLALGYGVFTIDGRDLELSTLDKTTDVLFLPDGTPPVRNVYGSVTRPKGEDGPIWVHKLGNYTDERGNSITYHGTQELDCKVKFTGRNNTLTVADDANVTRTVIDFDCDNGVVTIGRGRMDAALRARIRVGQDGRVVIGKNVSATTACEMSAAEGTVITVGEDVMFASDNALRADDGHPIFDVRTGRRVNVSRSITVGNHVWMGKGAAVLGGAHIGDGSVIGYGSVVTKSIPNNCIAAGIPARVVRRDIAWERPHLTLVEPFYKKDSSTVTKSRYWHLTVSSGVAKKTRSRLHPSIVREGVRRRVRAIRARLNRR